MTRLQGRGRSVRKFWKRHGYRATTVVVLAVFLAQAVLGNGVAYAAAAGIEVTADAVADATSATDGQQDTAEMQQGGVVPN